MTSIITIFILSLFISLVLTPKIRETARNYGIVDMPSERKVHTQPVPRIGGIAIFLSFFIAVILSFFYPTVVFAYFKNPQMIMLFTGAFIVFGLGLWDDIKSLGPGTKFAVQILAAGFAYAGGIKINIVGVYSAQYHLQFLSFPITIFWFLLVINAINLVDGLDGLAGGISLFVSIILLIICITTHRYIEALPLAVLSGSILGFLKYNFNPASIFMGDSGSYFIGYMLAGLSIMGSVKGSATVSMLIPVIALGLPLVDAVFSPIRRFILGQKLFSPDKKHLHHRLLALGLTHRKAVLILYGVCVILGILALITVHAKSENVALILIIAGAMVWIGIRKLGYIEYFGMARLHNWLKDIGDEMGISHDRRSFLNLQIEINESKSIDDLWNNICNALERLEFDMAEMHLYCKVQTPSMCQGFERLGFDLTGMPLKQMLEMKNQTAENDMIWTRENFDKDHDVCRECLMKMELPLIDKNGQSFGELWLLKDLKRSAITHYTLRRVEHLRRTVLGTLQILIQEH